MLLENPAHWWSEHEHPEGKHISKLIAQSYCSCLERQLLYPFVGQHNKEIKCYKFESVYIEQVPSRVKLMQCSFSPRCGRWKEDERWNLENILGITRVQYNPFFKKHWRGGSALNAVVRVRCIWATKFSLDGSITSQSSKYRFSNKQLPSHKVMLLPDQRGRQCTETYLLHIQDEIQDDKQVFIFRNSITAGYKSTLTFVMHKNLFNLTRV